jgi:hypothetical protein
MILVVPGEIKIKISPYSCHIRYDKASCYRNAAGRSLNFTCKMQAYVYMHPIITSSSFPRIWAHWARSETVDEANLSN